MKPDQIVELQISDMDCMECTLHVRKALEKLQGVKSAEVYLGAEKAVVHLDPEFVQIQELKRAVEKAGYRVLDTREDVSKVTGASKFTRNIWIMLFFVFGLVLFAVIGGEWLGFFEQMNDFVPWTIWLFVIFLVGYPIYKNVIQAALHRQIIAHTLMFVGVIAAAIAGEWITALLVTIFMRVGDYVEGFTTQKTRASIKSLTSLAPQNANVERDGTEISISIEEVDIGDTVILRPGEKVPVDGEVLSGYAIIDQSAITGEPQPFEAGVGTSVYAASLVQSGSLKVRAEKVGSNTTFGKVISLVEQTESKKANIQRVADRFSAYFLPLVLTIAVIAYFISQDHMAAVSVLVVACSCAFALATPIAMLASIGAGAKRGLLIKGGKYLEILDQAKVMLIDKTGTLTFGRPEIIDVEVIGSDMRIGKTVYLSQAEYEEEALRLAASAERYSSHPFAKAFIKIARDKNLVLSEPEKSEYEPGLGLKAVVDGFQVEVGNPRMFLKRKGHIIFPEKHSMKDRGRTILYIGVDRKPIAAVILDDIMRDEVPAAIDSIFNQGFEHVSILTGDRDETARNLARQIELKLVNKRRIEYKAELLPQDKIEIVREYQNKGYVVVMVGDGINDAPALAGSDVGIAMGAAGSDIAIESADIALLRDDWSLVPDVIRVSSRTMRVVRTNIFFTGFYNLIGLSLAALGILPPVLAAAAQSLPDLGILVNSSRLLRQK
ncbi:MAG: heavy metal translocating P-type ATPase [Anaerolineales bacterium]